MTDLFDGRPPRSTRPPVMGNNKSSQVLTGDYYRDDISRKGQILSPDTVAFGWNFDAVGILFIVLIPVIIWFILFVTRCPLGTAVYSNGNTEINTTKLGFYTGVITIIVYILLWIFITVIPRKLARY